MALEVIPYDPHWLAQVAALARAHARLVPPRIILTDEDVKRGLTEHAAWPFYSPGLADEQILLAVDGAELLAAGQAGRVDTGWGYGAAPGDGPDWLRASHVSLYWLFAWPGWPAAQEGAAMIAARVVGGARSQGLPGLEAFRGGPGFLPFGTQLSRYWPHLWAPLRAVGFRQPRDLLAFSGETAPEDLPALDAAPDDLSFNTRRGRVEAWWQGEPVGVSVAAPLGAGWGWGRGSQRAAFADQRIAEWAVIRRLVVDASVRGQGIGSALFAEQLRQLHRRGFAHYLLHIPFDPEDAPALRLYSKFGTLVDAQQVLRVSF
ncbi:MAG: GNAT family N-acetyltransferase [Chloroflexota bacterium]|nr:GNAT family N-acetyltransferase [Chloroflexota bacterium]